MFKKSKPGQLNDVSFTYSRNMRVLLSGAWLNVSTLGFIAANIVQDTVGDGSMAHGHFFKGQASWPALHPKTIKQKGGNSTKFYRAGTVYNAVTKGVPTADTKRWGSPDDVATKNAGSPRRYKAGGIYARMTTKRGMMRITTGFNGHMRHTKEFGKLRERLANSRGLDMRGMTHNQKRDAVAKVVSVKDVEKFIRENGLKIVKQRFTNRQMLGVQTDNLAYANVVQGNKSKPRPLLPYHQSDTFRIKNIVEHCATQILKALETKDL